jgi:hypothetical protein
MKYQQPGLRIGAVEIVCTRHRGLRAAAPHAPGSSPATIT